MDPNDIPEKTDIFAERADSNYQPQPRDTRIIHIAGIAIIAILLVVGAYLVLTTPPGTSQVAAINSTNSSSVTTTANTTTTIPATTQVSGFMPNGSVSWGITFASNAPSLSYNVIAVAQTDGGGYGPTYSLHGLSNTGYGYAISMAYDPISYNSTTGKENGYPLSGFYLEYRVYDAAGSLIYGKTETPEGRVPIYVNFSGPVYPNDTILIGMRFSGDVVNMSAKDWNTGASSNLSYTAFRGSYFIGGPYGPQPSNVSTGSGFTGLSTGEIIPNASFTGVQAVRYSAYSAPMPSAIMWIQAYSYANKTFSTSSSGLLAYNGSEPVAFSYLSTSEYSNSTSFTTGVAG